MSDDAATPAPTLAQKIIAEALGTFVLVFFGCGTALALFHLAGPDDTFGSFAFFGYVAIALAFGLTVLTMAYAVGHISGGHFNPAVSIGHAVSGRMPWGEAGIYASVQVTAGLVAGLVLLLVSKLFMDENYLEAVSNTWSTDQDAAWVAAFVLEMIGTFFFVFVILAVTDKRREGTGIPAPVAIGLSLTLAHLLLIGFTGAGVNPARSLGPSVFAGWDDALKFQWLYILAPLVGAAIAGFLYPAVYGYDRERPQRARKQAAPAGYPAPQGWDANQQQWAGAGQQQWGQPAQQEWGQPDAGAQQRWGQPAAPGQGQQGWSDPNAQQQWGDPNAGQWAPDAEDGRTQVRPTDPPKS